MKTVLERVEEVTKTLNPLNLKKVSLLSVKIANHNPSNGSLRIKGFLTENIFVEIFEFMFAGEIIKYSYTLVKHQKSFLRYDNSPHHQEIQTYPHHKYFKDKIYPLPNHQLNIFVKDVLKIFQ